MIKKHEQKILLLVPSESASGGIKNYFQVLKNEFSLPVEYMIRGARNWPYRNTFIRELYRAYKDLKTFKKRISVGDIGLVQTSTSLVLFSIIRDGLFIWYASKKGVKTIVFFRGWDIQTEKKIEKYFIKIFRTFFFCADKMIVLSSKFQSKLKEWGYKNEIFIESTIIDEKLLSNFTLDDIKSEKEKRIKNNLLNILFLARTEIPKGIYEAIDSYRIIKKQNHDLTVTLTIAGTGKELENVKYYIKKNNVNDVSILGYVEGNKKANCFKKADVYLFPTYTEGMPNSVLEAMAFGLPIITRNVGAIPDIIKQEENGFFTDSKDPKVFSSFIQKLIDDKSLRFEILENNYYKARNNYTTSKVVNRIERIYKVTLNETTNPTT